MDEKAENKTLTPNEAEGTATSEQDIKWDGDKYRPYLKQLPKKYWANERLNSFENLSDMVGDYLNPAPRAPEKYELDIKDDGISSRLSEAFRKADVDGENAKEIAELVKGVMPKRLDEDAFRQTYGDAYDGVMSDVDKALERVCDDRLRKSIVDSGLRMNPDFVKFAQAVGSQIGDGQEFSFKKEVTPPKRSGDAFTDFLNGVLK